MAVSARSIRLGLVLFSLVIVTTLTVNAQEDGWWSELMAASQGARVRVLLKDGTEATGRLVVARADAVVLAEIRTGSRGIRTAPGDSLDEGMTFGREDIAGARVLSQPSPAGHAQAVSFDQLGMLIRPGDTVSVTEASGARVSGTITGLSQSGMSLRVGRAVRDLSAADVAVVRQRQQDSLANGAKWGLGVGAAVGLVGCGSCHIGPGLAMAAVYGGIGAGIGVGIDALVKSDVVLYQRRDSRVRITAAPQLAKSHQGVTVSIKF